MPYAAGTNAIENNRVASTGDSLDAVARGDPFYQSAASFNFRKLGHGGESDQGQSEGRFHVHYVISFEEILRLR